MSKKLKSFLKPVIRYEEVPYKLPPEVKTENNKNSSIIISGTISLLSYLLTFYFTFQPGTIADLISKYTTESIEKHILTILVSVLVFLISFMTRKAWDIRKIPQQIALISISGLFYNFSKQRQKIIEEGIKNSVNPASYVNKFANDASVFILSDINDVVQSLEEGDMMFTVNSLDMVSIEELDNESVKEYLNTQKNIVKEKKVRIERQFRKLGGTNAREFCNSDSDKKIINQIIEELNKHNKDGFNPTIEFYSTEVERNPFLDYALVFHKGDITAFITYPIGKWITDKQGKKTYRGVMTSDSDIVSCLLKDRFSRKIGYKTYEKFLKEYQEIENLLKPKTTKNESASDET